MRLSSHLYLTIRCLGLDISHLVLKYTLQHKSWQSAASEFHRGLCLSVLQHSSRFLPTLDPSKQSQQSPCPPPTYLIATYYKEDSTHRLHPNHTCHKPNCSAAPYKPPCRQQGYKRKASNTRMRLSIPQPQSCAPGKVSVSCRGKGCEEGMNGAVG